MMNGRTDERTNGKKTQGIIVCLAVIGLFVCSSVRPFVCPTEAADMMSGKLADVSGEVEVQKRGESAWSPASNGMVVSPGDQINTGLSGHASLVFKNSVTEIQPLTQFVVGRVFEDGQSIHTELFLQIGKVVSNVDPNSGKNNKFTVTTPTAVAGVRGTRQECSFSQGFGTQVSVRDGAGFMAPVRPENLPPAVQAMLNVAPAHGGREGGVGKGDDKGAKGRTDERTDGRGDKGKDKGEKKEKEAQTVKEAVAEFNAWIAQSEQSMAGAGGADAVMPILDAATLDYVMPVADGLSATIQNATDPTAVQDAMSTLMEAATTVVTPAGTSAAEDKAQMTATEVVDAPVTVTSAAAAQEAIAEIIDAISSGSISPTTVPPPNRPTDGQGQGQ